MHDNPDPDVIAAGWSISCLLEEKLNRPVRIVGGGAIVRAENRHMVELLNPPIELVSEITCAVETAPILVDCGLGTTNHLVTRAGIEPVAVIDHHKSANGARRVPFRDIRTSAAASASIAASYLREQGIDPGMKLATADTLCHSNRDGGQRNGPFGTRSLDCPVVIGDCRPLAVSRD